MNKFILLTGLFFLLACSDRADSNQEKGEVTDKKEAHISHSLQLNDGKKWKLDQSTTKNIATLKSLITDTANKDFQKLAITLQQQTNILVSECKMEGPDHNALHLWLEQWLEHLRDFKENRKDQQEGYRYLQKDLMEFEKYFE
jgi:hypothetical protein